MGVVTILDQRHQQALNECEGVGRGRHHMIFKWAFWLHVDVPDFAIMNVLEKIIEMIEGGTEGILFITMWDEAGTHTPDINLITDVVGTQQLEGLDNGGNMGPFAVMQVDAALKNSACSWVHVDSR